MIQPRIAFGYIAWEKNLRIVSSIEGVRDIIFEDAAAAELAKDIEALTELRASHWEACKRSELARKRQRSATKSRPNDAIVEEEEDWLLVEADVAENALTRGSTSGPQSTVDARQAADDDELAACRQAEELLAEQVEMAAYREAEHYIALDLLETAYYPDEVGALQGLTPRQAFLAIKKACKRELGRARLAAHSAMRESPWRCHKSERSDFLKLDRNLTARRRINDAFASCPDTINAKIKVRVAYKLGPEFHWTLQPYLGDDDVDFVEFRTIVTELSRSGHYQRLCGQTQSATGDSTDALLAQSKRCWHCESWYHEAKDCTEEISNRKRRAYRARVKGVKRAATAC